jgi:hypothetical protein
MKKILTVISVIGFGIAKPALAHCPLCTAGAGVAAVGATWLGVGNIPVGIFIGAFAVALGLWVSRLLKKEYVPKQKHLIVGFSFFSTILPLFPLMEEYSSIYISWMGDYGSLLNRTYLIKLFLAGAILGGVIVLIAPSVSKKITSINKGRMIPYQGLGITFILLLVASLISELWS